VIAPSSQTKVVLFCGGRGSSTIIREFIRWPQVKLSLLVNAYDDGLSTGELRRFVPNMLGPSDFRKNLASLLNLYSSEQYALHRILEYRLPKDFAIADVAALEKMEFKGDLKSLFENLSTGLNEKLRGFLDEFFHHYRTSNRPLQFAECSVGNLIFAGAYLSSNHDFNASVRALAGTFGSEGELINVSQGEPCTLVALKLDGQVLVSEAEIVGPQSDVPILDIFFMPGTLNGDQMALLDAVPAIEQKRQLLKSWEVEVHLSPEAARAVRESDLIVYGPGTQFSSLFPSYRIEGLADCIRHSRATARVLVGNLETDHDIQSMSLTGIVDKALQMFGDPDNDTKLITHALYNGPSANRAGGIKLTRDPSVNGSYKNISIIKGDFQNPAKPSVHSGYMVVKQVFEVQESRNNPAGLDSLDIYVDLLDRSQATESILQEFLELPWQDRFEKVRLRLNRYKPAEVKLPPQVSVESTRFEGLFSEIDVLDDWLKNSDSKYLLTLTGDGEYRLRDVFVGLDVSKSGLFGAVYGSRTQSRRQFHSALQSAYGESRVLYWFSWMGAFLFSSIFALRFQLIFSDPLTGFRIYRRSRLTDKFLEALASNRPRTASEVTRLLIRSNVEVAEIPVCYRTFAGFTKASWRVGRALRNLRGAIF